MAEAWVISAGCGGVARPAMGNVLVVDRKLMVAEALAAALNQCGFEARASSPVSAGFLRNVAAWRPDVALIDVDRGNAGDCMGIIASLKQLRCLVVILAGQLDNSVLEGCIEAGAVGLIDKGSRVSDMVQTFERLLTQGLDGGHGELLTWTTENDVEPCLEPLPARFRSLTPREQYVLARLVEGDRAELIASKASVSVSTVRSQIKSIRRKLGVKSQLAAVALAHQTGWNIDAPSFASPRRAVRSSVGS